MIRLLGWLRRRLRYDDYGRRNPTNAERFETVFRTRRWERGQSVSGPGSDRDSGSVAHALRILDWAYESLKIRSVADVPCGDFHWFDLFLNAHPDVDYVGYDIVPDLIAQNRRTHPDRRFERLDIVRETPPAADIIVSKDLVNHLYERDVWSALRNMVASGSRYLMITSNTGYANEELHLRRPGASRELDLAAAPYNLTGAIYADHYLSVWTGEAVARRIAERDRLGH